MRDKLLLFAFVLLTLGGFGDFISHAVNADDSMSMSSGGSVSISGTGTLTTGMVPRATGGTTLGNGGISDDGAGTITFGNGTYLDTSAAIYAGNATISGQIITPQITGTTQKVLVRGTGTGPTQIAATQTTAPTCSASCGTSPSISGSDVTGLVTMGASGVPASPFTITFNGTWASAPNCIVNASKTGMVAGKAPILAVTSTTTLVVTTNGTAPGTSDTYTYICFGKS